MTSPQDAFKGLALSLALLSTPGSGAATVPGERMDQARALEASLGLPVHFRGLAELYQACRAPGGGGAPPPCRSIARLAQRPAFAWNPHDHLLGDTILASVWSHLERTHGPDSGAADPLALQRKRLLAFIDSTAIGTEILKSPLDSATSATLAMIRRELLARPAVGAREKQALGMDSAWSARQWPTLPESTKTTLTFLQLFPELPEALREARYQSLVGKADPLYRSPVVNAAYRKYALELLWKVSAGARADQTPPEPARKMYYHKMALVFSDALWEEKPPKGGSPFSLSSYLFGSGYVLSKPDSQRIESRLRRFGDRYRHLRVRMPPFARTDSLKRRFEVLDNLVRREISVLDSELSHGFADKLDAYPDWHIQLNIPGRVFPELIPLPSLAARITEYLGHADRLPGHGRGRSIPEILFTSEERGRLSGMTDASAKRKWLRQHLESRGPAANLARQIFARDLFFPYGGNLDALAKTLRLD